MNNNIRTMEFLGIDDWSRSVYKCVETGNLYKDITLGSKNPELYSCGNNFDGEPDCPIKSSLEIHFIGVEEQPTPEQKFSYQLLDRLRSDCEYYLGNGNHSKRHLWAGDEQEQIDKMKELWNSFSDDKKPEWLTMEQILDYERLMVNKESLMNAILEYETKFKGWLKAGYKNEKDFINDLTKELKTNGNSELLECYTILFNSMNDENSTDEKRLEIKRLISLLEN